MKNNNLTNDYDMFLVLSRGIIVSLYGLLHCIIGHYLYQSESVIAKMPSANSPEANLGVYGVRRFPAKFVNPLAKKIKKYILRIEVDSDGFSAKFTNATRPAVCDGAHTRATEHVHAMVTDRMAYVLA